MEQVAKRVARGISSVNSVDSRGWSGEDYTQELVLLSEKAAKKFQGAYGFCLPAEKRYVAKSLWRAGSGFRREQYRVSKLRYDYESAVRNLNSEEFSEESRYEARAKLRYLKNHLDEDQFKNLVWLAESGGLRQSYNTEDVTRDVHRKRMADLREKAKTLLEDF